MKNKLLYITIVVLLCNLNCYKEGNINGHWHIFTERGFPNEFPTLDIIDTISIWEKVRYGDWMKSIVDKGRKTIVLPPMGIYTIYEYDLKNDTLFLVEKGGDRNLYGIKRKPDECYLETDYFASFMLDINLPKIGNKLEDKKMINGLDLHLVIGKPKRDVKYLYGDSIRVEGNNGFVDLEEFELMNMKHDIKVSKKHLGKINTLIFADKNVPMSRLLSIVEKQRSVNNRNIFLVGKRDYKSRQKKDFTYLLLEKGTRFTAGETIENWIERGK